MLSQIRLRRNQPEQPRPAPRTIAVAEDYKKIDAVRAELRALKFKKYLKSSSGFAFKNKHLI